MANNSTYRIAKQKNTASVAAEDADAKFLRALGERVRQARAQRAMTRKTLAENSDVSERYIAQLESGLGNISVLLLRQVAHALHLPLTDLLQPGNEQTRELGMIRQMLEKMPEAKLAALRKKLMREINQSEAKPKDRIALIGLRGAGKSTLGAMLAKTLQLPFIELDKEIEKTAGMDQGEIFLLYGASGYRRLENQSLEKIIKQNNRAIISIGGGVVTETDTYNQLLENCYTVWVKANPEEHMARVIAQGDTRPMRDHKEAMQDLKNILTGREPLYARADLTLDTTGETAKRSLQKLTAALNLQEETT
jgi:XRE family transcriptional regulator, aerobic/anaerobic benzoate catabolism transcriptional regulator